jgi:hypothetical protein
MVAYIMVPEDTPVTKTYDLGDEAFVTITVVDIEHWRSPDVVVVYFDMSVEVKKEHSAIITLGNVSARYDGHESQKTWLATLADHYGNYEPRPLVSGSTIFHLYSVFPNTALLGAPDSFMLQESGVDFEDADK